MSENCQMHKRMEKDIEQFNKEKLELVKELGETKELATKNDEKIKVVNNRIKDLEVDNKNFVELITSVKVLATEIKHMVEKLNDHEGRLDNIEKKPGEYWHYLILCIISVLIGYVASNF